MEDMNRRQALSHLAAAPLGLAAFTVPGVRKAKPDTFDYVGARNGNVSLPWPRCCSAAKHVEITTHTDLPARVYLCTTCTQRVWAVRLDEDGMEDRP